MIQAALETYPGRAIINSINLENGRERVDAVLPLAREHGVGGGRADDRRGGHGEDGRDASSRSPSASTRSPPQSTACAPEALLFDALTFPVTTGQEELRDSAAADARGHPPHQGGAARRADHPGRQQRLVRRGASTRAPSLNSVFLYHAVQAGLDAAIVNPAHITPYAEIPEEQRQLCDDLLFNRRRMPCRASSPTSSSMAASERRRRCRPDRRA